MNLTTGALGKMPHETDYAPSSVAQRTSCPRDGVSSTITPVEAATTKILLIWK